jgi:uncharacterized protein YlaI
MNSSSRHPGTTKMAVNRPAESFMIPECKSVFQKNADSKSITT